jgi:hypothetical protein
MSEIGLQGTSIYAIVRELIAAGMPQHVGMELKLEAGMSRGFQNSSRLRSNEPNSS